MQIYAIVIWVCTYTKKTFTPAISTQEALGDHVDFALLQILLPLFWNNRSVLKSFVTRKAACKYSFVFLNFSRNGHLLNHLRKKHEPDANTCQQEPRNTISGCWNSQTPNLQRKAMWVHPAVLTARLPKFPLHNGFAEVRWLPH